MSAPTTTTLAQEEHHPLGPRERLARNRRIAEMRDQGETWPSIGEHFGLSERQARRCHADHLREAGLILDADPGHVLQQAFAVHVDALDRLRELTATADNSSAQLGAIRTRVKVTHDLLALLERAGVLLPPERLARMRLEHEKHAFVVALLDVLEARGVDVDELEGELDRVLAGGSG